MDVGNISKSLNFHVNRKSWISVNNQNAPLKNFFYVPSKSSLKAVRLTKISNFFHEVDFNNYLNQSWGTLNKVFGHNFANLISSFTCELK